MMGHMIILLSLLVVVRQTLSYSTDPNFSTNDPCQYLFPQGHGVNGQTSSSPYIVQTSGTSYTAGSTLSVTITRTSSSVQDFKGFILQARSVDNSATRVGSFSAISGTKTNCASSGGGTITHSNSNSKQSITVTWTAPSTGAGNIQFRATVVQERVVYWANITSSVVTGPAGDGGNTGDGDGGSSGGGGTSDGGAGSVSQSALTDVDLSGCGSTKSCFRYPSKCDSTNCEYIATWNKVNDRVEFELQGTVKGDLQYMTLALSKDSSMGDDSVMDCLYTGPGSQPITIQMSHNPKQGNNVVGQESLVQSSLTGSYKDGKIICKFTKLIQSSNNQVFNLNKDYTLLMAKGIVDGGTKIYHFGDKIKSSGQVNIGSGNAVDVGGSTGDPPVKAHGIMMILAWMLCTSFAIIMPRYFKGVWVEKKWCGKPVWFMIHYPCMVITVLLNSISFIVIFVQAKGYAQYPDLPSSAHPPLGIITTVLTLVNPIMAACRPAPDAPKRPIFNWCHFAVGRCAHILSIATIFIGVTMSKARMPSWCVWVMVAFIVVHVAIEVLLALYTYVLIPEKTAPSDNIPMDKQDSIEPSKASETKNNDTVKTALCMTHLVACIVLSLALIIPLAQGKG